MIQSERYAQEIIIMNNERYKREMEALAAQALADSQAQAYYRERLLAAPGIAIPGLATSSNPSAVVAAIQQAASQQQQQHQNHINSISANNQSQSSNISIISTSSPLSVPINNNNVSLSQSSSSIRRRPSLLPHNTLQNSEAFNLTLNNNNNNINNSNINNNSNTNGSCNIYNAGASSNAQIRNNVYSDREK